MGGSTFFEPGPIILPAELESVVYVNNKGVLMWYAA